MKQRVIIIGRNQYIGELMPYLPANAFINKFAPGCGGTMAELLGKRNSIIIVPNVPVIKGKVKKMLKDFNLEILGIHYPNNKRKQIVDYLLRDDLEFKNIMVTPESYRHLVDAFGTEEIKQKYDRHKDFFLLFDESEKIVQDVAYRQTITEPLDDFFLYKERSMISATPIVPSDYRFNQHGFEHILFKPNYDYSIDIELITTNSLLYGIREYLKSNPSDTYCFFMNSTQGILSIIKELGIENESQIFCSDDAVRKLRDKEFTQAYSELRGLKKYSFFTSRFYSAVDIDLDVKPNVVLLTDLYFAEHSIFDPATESIQAIGRFRNGINKATHITNTNPKIEYQTREMASRFLDGNFEAYQRIYTLRESSETGEANWKAYDIALNVLPFKNYVVKGTCRKDYYKVDNKLDEEMVRSYYRSEKAIIKAYKSVPHFKLTHQAVKCVSGDLERLKRSSVKGKQEIFKMVVEQLDKFQPSNKVGKFVIDNRMEVINELRRDYPEEHGAFYKYGIDKIKKAKYSLKKLEREDKGGSPSIYEQLPLINEAMRMFSTGTDLSCGSVNVKVNALKKKYNLKGTVKEILYNFFGEISDRYQRTIKDKRVWCIKLGSPKFILDS